MQDPFANGTYGWNGDVTWILGLGTVKPLACVKH